jgi:DNA repair protein RadD
MQGDHEMTDTRQPVQVCSVQTLQRRNLLAIGAPDLIVIDEAHNWFQFYEQLFATFPEVPVIGLSATPYTKGLGKHYSDLVIACSTQQLIDQGLLSPFRVYAPSHPDLSDVRIVAGDYHEGDLSKVMDKAPLIADAVETWRKLADGRPTLCYAVDRAHARHLQERYLAAGVPCAYMDANTELEERRAIGEQFARGEVKVVSNVGVLTTGIDWDVRCVQLVRPTRSEMLFQQIVGRGLRTAPGKDFCLILDHSDTHLKLGFVTDVDDRNLELDGGEKKPSAPKPRKERLPSECPSCHALRPAHARKCPSCGFAPVKQNEVEAEDGELGEFTGKKERFTKEQKEAFLGEVTWFARNKGYKPGWAAAKYREKFGVWPKGMGGAEPREPSPETLSWIKASQIRWAKRRTP